jgi:hypothetical protein
VSFVFPLPKPSLATFVVIGFTTVTPLNAGMFVTIIWPSRFLSFSNFGGAAPTGFSYNLPQQPPAVYDAYLGYSYATIPITASVPAAAYKITLTGATIGAPLPGPCSGISVSTTMDSAATCEYPSLARNTITSSVDIFDSASNAWSQASLSSPRMHLASASLRDVALFAGGFDGLPPSGEACVHFFGFHAPILAYF